MRECVVVGRGRGQRGGGERRPDLANVELGGGEASSIGCEMLTREAIGREVVDEWVEDDVSRMCLIGINWYHFGVPPSINM